MGAGLSVVEEGLDRCAAELIVGQCDGCELWPYPGCENVVVEGELAGWLVRTTGTHTGEGLGFPATGKPFETLSANLGRFRDGLAVEHWSEQGMLPMLMQLGVIPLPTPSTP